MKLKNKLTTLALSGYLALAGCTSLSSPSGTIELVSNKEASTLDTRIFVPLTRKVGLFVRNRSSNDYHGATSQFTLADISYNLFNGNDIFSEVQFGPDNKPIYRLGAQNFTKINDGLTTLVAPSVGLNGDPDLILQLRIKYAPKIYEDLRLFSQIETFTSLNMKGLQYSIERLRLGLEKNNYAGGLAVDFDQIGKDPENSYIMGLFLQKDF